MLSRTYTEWIAQGRKLQKNYLFCQGYCLDLTDFYIVQPNLAEVLNSHHFKDISPQLSHIFPNKRIDSISNILNQYRIGVIRQFPPERNGQYLINRRDKKKNGRISLQSKDLMNGINDGIKPKITLRQRHTQFINRTKIPNYNASQNIQNQMQQLSNKKENKKVDQKNYEQKDQRVLTSVGEQFGSKKKKQDVNQSQQSMLEPQTRIIVINSDQFAVGMQSDLNKLNMKNERENRQKYDNINCISTNSFLSTMEDEPESPIKIPIFIAKISKLF